MVETLVVLDPLADLARFEGVASAVAAATDAVDAVLRDRGLRKITDEQLSQALLAGATANAALTGNPDQWRVGALRLAAELTPLAALIRVAPGQAMARAHEPDSLATQLGCIQFPVELLVGGVAEHEGAVDPAEVDLLSRQLAHFSVISVPGVGHFIQEERPAVILAAVERMLAPSSPKRANEQSQGGNDASRPRR